MAKKVLASCLVLVLLACLGITVAGAPANDQEIIGVTYYAKGGIPGAPPDSDGDNNGYILLGRGVKWDLGDYLDGVPYKINTSDAPAGAAVEVSDAFEAWDDATSKDLFDYAGETGLSGVTLDAQNTVSWAPISVSGVIAQCSFWYNRKTVEIIEFDIVFNSNQAWGIDGDGEGTLDSTDKFDIRNIATHEAGHTLVLLDLYEASYNNMTMYGYGSLGETKKISLESGDIAGLQALYGS